MKKIFKGLAVLAATATVGAGLAFATGCGGKNGKYIGSYSYVNYGHTYGVVVEVTVKNNIITRVEDVTFAREDSKDWVPVSAANPDYGWTESAVANWNTNEEWLLAQYEGWSVADVLALKAFVKTGGEPYSADLNTDVVDSSLVISGATQGSVRILLAVQDALGKTTEYGRVHSAK